MVPRQNGQRRRIALSIAVGEQDADVLNRRNQVILDLLSPKPPPVGALEMMVIACIGKAPFHEMVPASAVPPGRATVRLAARYI